MGDRPAEYVCEVNSRLEYIKTEWNTNKQGGGMLEMGRKSVGKAIGREVDENGIDKWD